MIFLSPTEKQFIQNHITDDVRELALLPHPVGLDIKRLVAQISARQKAREKLPTWYANKDLHFPPALSVEQASSERTALYKSSLVSGTLLLDLTGGMGVDTWAFSQRMERVVYVEQQADLAELAACNLPLLGALMVDVRIGNGMDLVNSRTDIADWVYLDPHRRNDQGGKVVRLEDCEPNVSRPETISALLTKANRILLKASPLLDVDSIVRQLKHVEMVHVVAVQGEAKEVLLVLGQQAVRPEAVVIKAVNLTTTGDDAFQFVKGEEHTATVSLSNPLRYVYEPNAAVLKAGAFRSVAAQFDVLKLAPNSHLYTSDELKADFPGRIFNIEHVIKPDRKTLQTFLPTMKANLTVRNFPQSVAELRKKLGLSEGGDTYILATTLQNNDKRLLITKKVITNHN